jgi:putative Ca2+/H+ antiporter (TMEM165/GDT1 family)
MNLKTFALVFATVFLAELGDKTQLATVLFAAERRLGAWPLFLVASLALVCAAGIGVLAGGFIAKHVDVRILSMVAGAGFIAIGMWTLIAAFRSG